MNQNSELLQLQLLKQDADSVIAVEQAYVGEHFAEVWQKHLEDPENLSLAEMRIMESFLYGQSVYRWWKTYELYKRGLISEQDWKTPINQEANYVLNHEYGLAWWAELRSPGSEFQDEFLDYIDLALGDVEKQGPAPFYQRVQDRIRATRRD